MSNGDDYGIYDADDDDDTPLHRIKQREVERWAMENERDSTFADMYLHPRKSRQMWRWRIWLHILNIHISGMLSGW